MLGDIGISRLGEAQAGSGKECMETGEHTSRYGDESSWEHFQCFKKKKLYCQYFPREGRQRAAEALELGSASSLSTPTA